MGRKSVHRISEEKQEIMRKIIEGYNVQTTSDLQEALKDLLGGTIQTMLVSQGERITNMSAKEFAVFLCLPNL